MKFMCPEKRVAKLFLLLLVTVSLTVSTVVAQKKKPAAKNTATQKKDAKKVPAKTSRNAKSATAKKTKSSSKATAKTRKPTAKELAAQKKADKAQKSRSKKPTAAERRAEAARQKKESARRAAALAEQRRREQAAREARARKIAFEKGLRTETIANILRDSTEGEDLRIRQTAVNALGERAGTVVVMEAKTGKIVTMVNQEWAVRHGFKPCSTIKLVTGVAGLNEGLITADGRVTGSVGGMELDYALAKSNNAYFQRVGANLGSEKMISYAKRLGLGQPTGINLDRENAGKLPYGNNNARIYSHADDFEVTPLQLAVMVTALSNGGDRIVPKVSKARVERTASSRSVRGTIDLPSRSYQGVLPGMMGAAEYGTASRSMDKSLGVAGKTGSCIGRGSWVGLFASVAPVEDPKYAVVVITRGQSERGRYAAAIAADIYRALAPDMKRDQQKLMAIKQIGNPSVNTPNNALAEADDEESDDDTPEVLETNDQPQRPVIVAGSNSRPTNAPVDPNKKVVTRTSQSKPVFKPVVIPYSKDDAEDGPKAPAPKNRPRVVKNR
jgi:membrane peptidoglycan carboxypeptidase